MDALTDPQYKTADGSALRIWRDTMPNNFLSEKAGRPVYDEVILVEVISPGSGNSTPVFEVERTFAPEMNHAPLQGPQYAQFKQYIEAFVKNEEGDASLAGTPLKEWLEMKRGMVASLTAQNIFTVEALAALPDTRLPVVGPDGRTWREKAKAYLENSKGGAYATALAGELDRTKADLVASEERVSALAKQVEALMAASGGTATAINPVAPAAPEPAPEPTPKTDLLEGKPEIDPVTNEAVELPII